MFFDNWTGILRILIAGSLAYVALVFLLRISGKRTLSKMNAFDLVITVAIGSSFSTVVLSKDVAFVEGVLALALLIFLQFAVTWLSVRSGKIKRFVKAEPSMLVYKGELLHDEIKRERVTEEEIAAALRKYKVSSRDEVQAVVLETDGTFSIIPKTGKADSEGYTSLEYVRNYREE